jgi:hypothetical protein
MLRYVIPSGFGLSHDLLLQILGQPDGGLDVSRLAGLVAADKQDDNRLSSFREVDAVPRAVVDAQLRYALSHLFRITEVARHNTLDANENTRPRSHVAKPVEPAHKRVGFSNFEHTQTVANWLLEVNVPCSLAVSYARQYGVEVRIARIFNTYGPRMHENDGRVVSNFVVQALAGQPLTVFDDGKQTRSFCYVSDLVEGFVRLMARGRGERAVAEGRSSSP